MKKILLGLMVVSNFAYAGQENHGISGFDPEAVYKALKVEPVQQTLPGENIQYRLVKSVGGLSCDETLMVNAETPVYTCGVDVNKQNFEEVYNFLDVNVEILKPETPGVYRAKKSVGGLTCITTKLVIPGAVATYSCEISG